MDWTSKYFGGRKFLMALITIGAAMFMELSSPKGLTETMAMFLAGIVTAFSATNYLSSAAHMKTKNGGNSQPAAGLPPEQAEKLIGVLNNLGVELQNVKETTSQIGKGVLSLLQRK